MATEMMTWARRQVFDAFGLTQNEAMVLLLIADNSSWNEETGQWTAWPSQATLARDTRATDRSVRRAVTRLVDLGILSTQRRRTQAGFLRGNLYVLHPEVVARPVTLTRSDRVTGDEQSDSGRPDTVSGLEIPREDTLSGAPSDPRDSKTGHTVRSVDNSAPTGHSVRSHRTRVSGLAREVNARASLNHQLEPSSSSSSVSEAQTARSGEGAAGGAPADDDDDRGSVSDRSGPVTASGDTPPAGPTYRGVELGWLGRVVSDHTGITAGSEALIRLVDEVLSRSRRRVGHPVAFLRAAVTNDPEEIASLLGGRAQPARSPASPVSPPGAGRRLALCPIPEHADSTYLEVNCPACRFGDFPTVVTGEVLTALRPDIQDRVRAAEATGHVLVRETGDDRSGDRVDDRAASRSGDRSPDGASDQDPGDGGQARAG